MITKDEYDNRKHFIKEVEVDLISFSRYLDYLIDEIIVVEEYDEAKANEFMKRIKKIIEKYNLELHKKYDTYRGFFSEAENRYYEDGFRETKFMGKMIEKQTKDNKIKYAYDKDEAIEEYWNKNFDELTRQNYEEETKKYYGW